MCGTSPWRRKIRRSPRRAKPAASQGTEAICEGVFSWMEKCIEFHKPNPTNRMGVVCCACLDLKRRMQMNADSFAMHSSQAGLGNSMAFTRLLSKRMRRRPFRNAFGAVLKHALWVPIGASWNSDSLFSLSSEHIRSTSIIMVVLWFEACYSKDIQCYRSHDTSWRFCLANQDTWMFFSHVPGPFTLNCVWAWWDECVRARVCVCVGRVRVRVCVCLCLCMCMCVCVLRARVLWVSAISKGWFNGRSKGQPQLLKTPPILTDSYQLRCILQLFWDMCRPGGLASQIRTAGVVLVESLR